MLLDNKRLTQQHQLSKTISKTKSDKNFVCTNIKKLEAQVKAAMNEEVLRAVDFVPLAPRTCGQSR